MGEAKRVLLFGGTTEGRSLAEWLAKEACRLTVCIATEYGKELLEEALSGGREVEILCGRLDEPQMEELFLRIRPELVIDATHPYASVVTENVKMACSRYGRARYLRCLREGGSIGAAGRRSEAVPEALSWENQVANPVLHFRNMDQAVEWLQNRPGNILVTTGSKELSRFAVLSGFKERVYARVLPLEDSIALCRSLGLSGRHIIGMQGPFSEEMNLAHLREYGCRFLVTKDGGRIGGFTEKLNAAGRAGAVSLVICRPQEEGVSLEAVKLQVKEWLRHE